MKNRNSNPTSEVSRREFLNIFAAGAAAAVGTVSLAPLGGIVSAQDRRHAAHGLADARDASIPRSASGDSEIAVLNAVYDYLIETDAAANLVRHVLASSWSNISDDGLVYTLQLREDASLA